MNNSVHILLNSIEKVHKFVSKIETLSSDIDASPVDSNYTVDARSGIGLFSMDLKKPIVITLHSQNERELEIFNEIMEEFK